MPLDLISVLQLYGFDVKASTRLVRHQDHRYPIEEFRRSGQLELYQRYQARPVFHNTDQIVVFYGMSGNRAGLYGVFRVRGHRPASEGLVEGSFPPVGWRHEDQFFYDLDRDDTFDDLRDRLIIDWGPGALAWVQKLRPKEVLEILPPGRRLPAFDDYLEFSLTYDQLKDLFEFEEAHRDWRTSPSAVGGVYLILAEGPRDGEMYIGSAYGVEGVWGRWREYAKLGHGGDELLRKLIECDPASYPARFRFSLLQILPKSMRDYEIIRRETLYKRKLGSRAFGLNPN